MVKQPIFGKDPEKISRLLSIGEDEQDFSEVQEDVVDSPASSDSMTTKDEVIERLHTRIEGYRIIKVLGEGGMGIVYLAEQQYPVHRPVALKIIKPGMDSKRVMARFEAEQQALARLDHPNIAHVYDAGTTEAGQPYFVMEFVKGLPITEYCDRHKLAIEDRLNLFLNVCKAVQHAHQKGIIHRDIKPSNILVCSEQEDAIPKIIDFGVAKATSQPLTEHTLATEDSQLLGTPEYMSPEQVDMANEDIDTRSDIYSLGVLLYVLLAGVLPFDSGTFREGGIENIRKVIRETDPKTPSTRLNKLGEEAKRIAENRQTEIGTLTKRLRKELEWIPLKAVRKERSERYRTASELADDIENYIKGIPLIAGPLRTSYKLKKFVRRNRVLVGGIIAVLVVLAVGIVVSTILALGQARARSEAQAVSDFLQNNVLGSLNLWQVHGEEITIRSILDATSQSLTEKLGDQPLVEASIRWTLSNAYGMLGLYKPAELEAERALEIRQAELGTENMETLHSTWQLGWLHIIQGHCYEAEPLLTKALTAFEDAFNEEHFSRLYCMDQLGFVYIFQGRFLEAEKLFVRGLDTIRRVLGSEHEYEPTFLLGLGYTYHYQGRYDEAERFLTEGLDLSRRVRGEPDLETMFCTYLLGELRCDQGRYKEAEKLLERAAETTRQVLGEQHPRTLLAISALGGMYYKQGRYEQAEQLIKGSVETFRCIGGDEDIHNLLSMHKLGVLYLRQDRCGLAEPLLDEMLEIGDRILGEENWFVLSVKTTLAQLYTVQGRYEEAEQLFDKILETQRRVLGDEHPHTLDSMNGSAVLLTKQKKHDDAERLFNEALNGRQNKLGDEHPATLESRNDLSVLYKEKGDYDKAESLLLEALEGRRLKLGDTHPHTLESWKNLIDLYEGWGKPEKAEGWRIKLQQIEAVDE